MKPSIACLSALLALFSLPASAHGRLVSVFKVAAN